MRQARRCLRAACAAVALSLAACAAPPPGGSPPRGRGAAPSAELQAAAATVSDWCRRRFPDHYGGLVLEGERAVVYRRPSAAFDASLAAEFPTLPLVVRDAAYSEATLLAATQRIARDLAVWNARGLGIHTVGPLPDASGVQVGVAGAGQAERARKLLTQAYGVRVTAERTPPPVAL